MANQVAARLSGDDYQHLYTWLFVLELLMPNQHVLCVTVEDAQAGSVDDVTVEYEAAAGLPSRFFQVKYHVDLRETYSTEALLTKKSGNQACLLEKFWRSWCLLHGRDPHRLVELTLVSNWAWDPHDPLRMCISGQNTALTEAFFAAAPGSPIEQAHRRWQEALQAEDEEFAAFARSLRFQVGFDCADDLEQRVAERMGNHGLKSDMPTLLVAVGIVRRWIEMGHQEVTRDVLEQVLHDYDLFLPPVDRPSVTVYLTTIKHQQFELPPDYLLDWRAEFDGPEHTKRHAVLDPTAWNARMLPELAELESRIGRETNFRLVCARGRARLSAWVAFGFTFSEVAGYTIEVEQGDQRWRTDVPPSSDFALTVTSLGSATDGEVIDGSGEMVAVGISVSAPLDDDVRAYLRTRTEPVTALLLLRPSGELSRTCLRDARDAVALADEIKRVVRAFVKRWSARRLLLFYCGPLSGACFIGHRLNAVCREIQIMEDQQPGYAPSFLLM